MKLPRHVISGPGRRLAVSLAASVLAFAFTAWAITTPAGAAKAKTPYVFGAILALSGPNMGSSAPVKPGLETAIININNAGGINGHKIVLDAIDDTSSPTTGAIAAQQLIASDHPIMSAIDSPSATQNAELPFFAVAKIPTLTNVTVPPTPAAVIAQDPYNYEFYPADPPLSAAEQLYGAKFLADKQPLKLAVLYDTETTFENRFAILQAEAPLVGSLVGSEQVSSTALDVSIQIAQLKATGANVLMLQCSAAASIAALNAIEAQNWNVKIMAAGGLQTATYLTEGALPPLIDNNFNIATTRLAMVDPKTGGIESAFRAAVHDMIKDEGPITALATESTGYEMAYIFEQAILDAKSTNGLKLAKAMNHHFVVPTHSVFFGQPNWTASIHTMENANISQTFGLVRPGTPYLGAYPGVYYNLPSKIPASFYSAP